VASLVAGGWWLVAGGWWLVAGGWWLVAGGWWLVAGGWWLVAGGWCGREREGALFVNHSVNLRASFSWHWRFPNQEVEQVAPAVVCDSHRWRRT
jgi:hypothetical protein